MEIFKSENLSFKYPECENFALENINFSVSQGEFIVLCGASGCGKSTLLSHLKSVFMPSGVKTGEVLFKGIIINEVADRVQAEEIGFVGQSPDNQIVTDKVWHELAFGLESLGLDNDTIRRRTAEMASFFGIEAWFEKSVYELSGGQKQILNLASVMVMQPSVLILDEPTSQLDPIASKDFIEIIGRINRELGTTVIITEHRLDDVVAICDRLLVMENGHLVCDDTPLNAMNFLRNSSSKMFLAMPSPMKIWSSVKTDIECPLTVAQGRKWLLDYLKHNKLYKVCEKEIVQDENLPVLEAKNLWFRYDKNGADILKGASIKAYNGKLLAILGGNGVGKTTLVSTLSDGNYCYRGEVLINQKPFDDIKNPFDQLLGILPQNPQLLFVKKTVKEDLYEMFSGKKIDKKEQDKKIFSVSKICQLESLFNRHPYDLSGGEQQRCALAKVLLTQPKILILDEPTKGIDAEFKQILAGILRRLCKKGVAIIMVSHDIEFCAMYADSCAMLFNGSVVSQNTPAKFFCENNFYTTSSARMSRGIIENAVTVCDVVEALTGKRETVDEIDVDDNSLFDDSFAHEKNIESKNQVVKKLSIWRKIFAVIAFLIFGLCVIDNVNLVDFSKISSLWDKINYYVMVVSCVGLMASLWQKNDYKSVNYNSIKKRKLSKRTLFSTMLILLAIPLTVYIGVYYLGDKKYLFISLVVMIECMLPFFMIFEGRKPQSRELVVIAVLCALGVAGRAAFYMLPQFKPVTALVIIAGVAFGGETGFLVGAITMLASNMIFMQGPWTPWQMFSMGIIGFLAGVLFRKGMLSRDKYSLAVFGGISAVVIYGGIMNPASAIISRVTINKATLVSYYAVGLPMDLVHGIATALILFFLAPPMLEKLDRIKVKYGLIE